MSAPEFATPAAFVVSAPEFATPAFAPAPARTMLIPGSFSISPAEAAIMAGTGRLASYIARNDCSLLQMSGDIGAGQTRYCLVQNKILAKMPKSEDGASLPAYPKALIARERGRLEKSGKYTKVKLRSILTERFFPNNFTKHGTSADWYYEMQFDCDFSSSSGHARMNGGGSESVYALLDGKPCSAP